MGQAQTKCLNYQNSKPIGQLRQAWFGSGASFDVCNQLHIGIKAQIRSTVRVKRLFPSAPRTIGNQKKLRGHEADWPCFLSVQITPERFQLTQSSESPLQLTLKGLFGSRTA